MYVGINEGNKVGPKEGSSVGCMDGEYVGRSVGLHVGTSVGTNETHCPKERLKPGTQVIRRIRLSYVSATKIALPEALTANPVW